MAYIAKVTVTNSWTKLETLIKAIDGLSTFAFDTSKKYSIQVDGSETGEYYGVYFCNSTTTPTEPDDGEHMDGTMFSIYEPESGADLYVKKVKSLGVLKVSVSEL